MKVALATYGFTAKDLRTEVQINSDWTPSELLDVLVDVVLGITAGRIAGAGSTYTLTVKITRGSETIVLAKEQWVDSQAANIPIQCSLRFPVQPSDVVKIYALSSNTADTSVAGTIYYSAYNDIAATAIVDANGRVNVGRWLDTAVTNSAGNKPQVDAVTLANATPNNLEAGAAMALVADQVVVLKAATHTGAVIPTVTTVTTAPADMALNSTVAKAADTLNKVTWTDARAAKIDNLDASVSSRSTLGGTEQTGDSFAIVNSGTNGNAAIKTAVGNIPAAPSAASVRAEIDSNSTQLSAIKAKTDNLPASPAAVGSAMTLTSSYDAAKTAAPSSTALDKTTWTDARAGKIDNLDAAVTTRSTLTAGAKMDLVDDPNATGLGKIVLAVWSALISGMSVTGSVGEKLKNWVVGTPQTGDSFAIVNDATNGNSAIKTAIGSLPSAPSASAIRSEIDSNSTKLSSIKTKTDNIPLSPAAVGSAMTLTSDYDKAKGATQTSDIPTVVQIQSGLAKTSELPNISNLAEKSDVSPIGTVTTKLSGMIRRSADNTEDSFKPKALENTPSPSIELSPEDVASLSEAVSSGVFTVTGLFSDAALTPSEILERINSFAHNATVVSETDDTVTVQYKKSDGANHFRHAVSASGRVVADE